MVNNDGHLVNNNGVMQCLCDITPSWTCTKDGHLHRNCDVTPSNPDTYRTEDCIVSGSSACSILDEAYGKFENALNVYNENIPKHIEKYVDNISYALSEFVEYANKNDIIKCVNKTLGKNHRFGYYLVDNINKMLRKYNDQIFFDVESGIIKYAITSDKTMVIKRRDRLIAIVFYKNGREISPVEKYGKVLIDFKYIYDAVVEMRECYEMIVYRLCDMLSNPSFTDVPQNYNVENDGRGTFEKSNDVIVIS